MRPLGILNGYIRRLFTVTAEALSLGTPSSLVATNTILISKSFHELVYPGGGTQNVDQINGGVDGQILVLKAHSTSNDIRLRDEVGNLLIAGNFVLNSERDTITLIRNGNSWYELARSNN